MSLAVTDYEDSYAAQLRRRWLAGWDYFERLEMPAPFAGVGGWLGLDAIDGGKQAFHEGVADARRFHERRARAAKEHRP